jgi:hypothetical protein
LQSAVLAAEPSVIAQAGRKHSVSLPIALLGKANLSPESLFCCAGTFPAGQSVHTFDWKTDEIETREREEIAKS